jgi:hypothetical protein
MKSIIKTVTPCLLAVLLAGTGTSNATIVTVDSSMSNGYMSWFNLTPSGEKGSFITGESWGFSALKSTFGPTGIILEPNYNTYADNPNNSYWRNNDGAGPEGNKWMEASSFTAVAASNFTDGICNFKAEVSAYSLTPGYTVRAFIKGFNANYSSNFALFSDPIDDLNNIVDLEFITTGWVNIQYGFEVQGINANPANPQGSATVMAAEPPPLVYGIPNAGFEIPEGAQWAFDEANGHTVLYPAEGGNPGGFAAIDSTQASEPSFAVLVSNGRLPLPLAALSLIAGQTYTFAMDMKILDGSNIGGFKVDFLPGDPANTTSPNHTTGDMYPTPSTTPGEWSTYSFPVTIPANATGVKLVPLWGPGSIVGYDNVRVAGPFAATATTVGSNVKISWPSVTGRTYQVKKSNNLVNWSDFGASTPGNGSTFTVTDPIGTPGKAFFQVIETKP